MLKEPFFWLHCSQRAKPPASRELSPVPPGLSPAQVQLWGPSPAVTLPDQNPAHSNALSLRCHQTTPSTPCSGEHPCTPILPTCYADQHTTNRGKAGTGLSGGLWQRCPDMLELLLLNKNKIQRQKVPKASDRSRNTYGV